MGSVANAHGARNLGLRWTRFASGLTSLTCFTCLPRALLVHRGLRGFSGGASRFFGAQCFDANGFLTGRFGGHRFAFGGGARLGFRRCGGSRCMFLRRGLNIGSLAAPADGFSGGCRRCGRGCRLRNRGTATAPCSRRGRRLLFGTNALFSLPSRPDASDLIVGEHAHVAANRNVHGPKK
jgi:hypothetical protein